MSQPALSASQLKNLTQYDTPTICNALEVLDSKTRTSGFTYYPMVCAFPELPSIVGYAKTATMRAMGPSPLDKDTNKKMRFAYYDHVGAGELPKILVIQDLDSHPGYGAYWGEVQTHVHQALGCVGGVTNGSIRDLDAMAKGFQMLAGSIGPSHAWVHLHGFGEDVNIFGMQVKDGDLIHADRHGSVVIPHDLAPKVEDACQLLTRKEAVILNVCKQGGFTIDKLKKAVEESEQTY